MESRRVARRATGEGAEASADAQSSVETWEGSQLGGETQGQENDGTVRWEERLVEELESHRTFWFPSRCWSTSNWWWSWTYRRVEVTRREGSEVEGQGALAGTVQGVHPLTYPREAGDFGHPSDATNSWSLSGLPFRSRVPTCSFWLHAGNEKSTVCGKLVRNTGKTGRMGDGSRKSFLEPRGSTSLRSLVPWQAPWRELRVCLAYLVLGRCLGKNWGCVSSLSCLGRRLGENWGFVSGISCLGRCLGKNWGCVSSLSCLGWPLGRKRRTIPNGQSTRWRVRGIGKKGS